MLLQTIKTLVVRDLEKLRAEIESYRSEENIWRIEKKIANSAGNLCLHLIGNLNTYIGTVLGNTGYVRNRDLEFSVKDVSREELLQKIDATIPVVEKTLDALPVSILDEEYPMLIWAEKTSTEYLLLHLITHFNYHLGQINYHRRLLDA
jgi:uncharacterized damage-inducible protein DinB